LITELTVQAVGRDRWGDRWGRYFTGDLPNCTDI